MPGGRTEPTAGPQQRRLPDQRLHASVASAPADRAGRIEDHVTDLAGQSSSAGQSFAIDDHAGAHADLPDEVDRVARAPGRPSQVFRHRADIGIVGQSNGYPGREPGGEQLMKWLVPPAQIRRLDDHLVPNSHRARQAHAHPDEERAGWDRARSSPRQPGSDLLPRCSPCRAGAGRGHRG